jgi:hypothetical protein
MIFYFCGETTYNTSMVKTWRYSSLSEFEQIMLSISEISRIYSLRSLKKIECVPFHIYTIQYFFFTRFIAVLVDSIFVFWFIKINNLMSSFKSCIRRKSQSVPKSLKKYTSSELKSNFQPLCHVKGTGRGTVWHIMAICTKRENVIGANRRHFYQVVSV